MRPDKTKPVKELIRGHIETINRQETLIINHIHNEDFNNKERIVSVISEQFQKIRDALHGIHIFMDSYSD